MPSSRAAWPRLAGPVALELLPELGGETGDPIEGEVVGMATLSSLRKAAMSISWRLR